MSEAALAKVQPANGSDNGVTGTTLLVFMLIIPMEMMQCLAATGNK
jgi:hypothetical protein